MLWQKLSDVYSMAKQRWAGAERSWCIRPSASKSSALTGKREGIPGSAINDNNTITCHGDECSVETTANLLTATRKSSKIPPVTLPCILKCPAGSSAGRLRR